MALRHSTKAGSSGPVISNLAISNIQGSSAVITWTTDVPSDSQVEYGQTAAYGTLSPLDSTLVTSHSVTLQGLTAGTLYHFRTHSKALTLGTDASFSTTVPSSSCTGTAFAATVLNLTTNYVTFVTLTVPAGRSGLTVCYTTPSAGSGGIRFRGADAQTGGYIQPQIGTTTWFTVAGSYSFTSGMSPGDTITMSIVSLSGGGTATLTGDWI